MTSAPDFQQRLRQIETLVAALEDGPDPATRENARALVRALLELHAAGLAQMLHLAEPLVERLASDPLVSSVLVLHGLHPVPLAERISQTLERVRADLHRNGGAADLVEVAPEGVRLRLRGDASAGPTLRRLIEAALIESAPDVPAICFEEAWDRHTVGRIALPLS